MENTIQKYRQSSIFFEKTDILSDNLKTLTSSNYPTVQYFFLELWKRFLLSNVYERMRAICFIILFRSRVICKNLKRPGFYTLVFYIFINNLSSKQNKKTRRTLLQTLLSRVRMQHFSKKYQTLW